jgi:GntR family transcriptional repressor for pyruvate dehydrogenase complex
MPYIKITQPKLADAIVAELESMILEGSLQPGQKLPPERELAIQFQVSRPSLREAIQRLEARDSCIVVRAVALTYKMP